jgi:putative ABC transport system substrate-binding protein
MFRPSALGDSAMKRREFIGLIGGAAVLPLAARAQQSPMPVVGYLGNWLAGSEPALDGFRRGLKEMGFVEGQSVVIDYRWAEGRPERHAEFAADLVRRRVAVIYSGNNVGALAAKAATSEIPIVFAFGLDPVLMGLVSSINRPGGNATGVSIQVSALEPKKFELLRNILPSVSMVGAMVNPDNPNAENQPKDLGEVASTFGLKLIVLGVRNIADIDAAFATLVRQHAGALLVTSDPLFQIQRHQLVDLAARNAIPAMYPWRDFADAGGLMSYGPSLTDAFRQGGVYTGRILKGEKPGNLPVWQPTKFEFVINLKTAKALGLSVPPALLVAADEVIE